MRLRFARYLRVALRRMGRLRWLSKYRIVRAHGRSLLGDRALGLRYVLWDPELESYTYDLANEDELARQLAGYFGVSEQDVASYMREAHQHPELNDLLERRLRWRFAWKKRLPLGNRMAWYVIVRIRRPQLVAESGVLSGLGSLAVLCALERNAAEGYEGHLVSADTDPSAGSLVPARMRRRWTKLVGTSVQTIPDALEGRRIGVFIQDSPHTLENQTAEFSLALRHADTSLVLVDSGGGQTPALAQVCAERKAERLVLHMRPARHVYAPTSTDVALISEMPTASPVSSA